MKLHGSFHLSKQHQLPPHDTHRHNAGRRTHRHNAGRRTHRQRRRQAVPPAQRRQAVPPAQRRQAVMDRPVVLLRKEVIQPHLPVRLPCYDFVPIASPTFDHSLR